MIRIDEKVFIEKVVNRFKESWVENNSLPTDLKSIEEWLRKTIGEELSKPVIKKPSTTKRVDHKKLNDVVSDFYLSVGKGIVPYVTVGIRAVLEKYASSTELLKKVVCVMLYYGKLKNGTFVEVSPTSKTILRQVCDLFALLPYSSGSIRTEDEVEQLLNEERFREYDEKAEVIVRNKFKKLFDNKS